MYLAVCDDNIADRKQTERLLGRQSDRVFKESGERIYIDSYGNVDAFMHNPQMYHGLFIDMVSGSVNGFDILKELLKAGIDRPIIMCASSIDYRKRFEEEGLSAPNVYFLEKPLKVAEVTQMVDMVKSLCVTEEPALELRGKDETVYAKGDEIICAKRVRNELLVYLTEGREISILDDIVNFYDQCHIFPQICPVNDNAIININHIAKTSFGKVTLDNSVSLPVSFTYRNAIKQTKENLSEIQNNK